MKIMKINVSIIIILIFVTFFIKIQNQLISPINKDINSYYIKICFDEKSKRCEFAKINMAIDFSFIPLSKDYSFEKKNNEIEIFSENEIIEIDNLEYNTKLISSNYFYIDKDKKFNINNFKFYYINKKELNWEEISNNRYYSNLYIGQIGLGPFYDNDNLNLVQTLKNNNIINYTSFGVSLDNKNGKNFIFFGKINDIFEDKKYSLSINLDNKLLKKYKKWGMKIDGLVVETNNKLIKHTRHKYFAYFNLIEDRIFVPDKIMEYLISKVFKIYIKNKICFVTEYNEKKFVNCKKDKIIDEIEFFPKIIFVIKKYIFKFNFEDLFIESLNKKEMVFIIQKNYYDIDTSIICFGSRFFKKFIIEFDFEKNNIIFNSKNIISTINLDSIKDNDLWKDIIKDPNKETQHFDTNYGNEGKNITQKNQIIIKKRESK